ncbi:MAG: hypothetical protein JW782_07990 [Candidatus Saganbacteria bacterium]|nr:hypothetical protein [Candidatus Saganbacteria bacterium]
MNRTFPRDRFFSWLLTGLLAVTIINYPNPVNPAGGQSATFEATCDATTEAVLYIYDMSARLLLRRDFNLTGGGVINRTGWNGYNNYNEPVGNGIYLYSLISRTGAKLGKGKIWVINQ